MTYETAHKILSAHQAWRRGLVDAMEYTAAYLTKALEVAITALQSDPNAPDWSQAPGKANYYAIDADGQCWFYEFEPEIRKGRMLYSMDIPGWSCVHQVPGRMKIYKRPGL